MPQTPAKNCCSTPSRSTCCWARNFTTACAMVMRAVSIRVAMCSPFCAFLGLVWSPARSAVEPLVDVSPGSKSFVEIVTPGSTYPGVVWVVTRLHRPYRLIPREHVQVVPGVPLSDGKRVIPLRHQQQVAVVDHVGRVGLSVRGVEPLQPKSIRGVNPVVIDLLEIGLVRHVVHVMLVWRIGGPVAARCEDLHHEETISRERRFDDVVDLARRIARAADLNLHIVRRHQPRRESMLRAGSTHGQLERGLGADLERTVARQIDRPWLTREGVLSFANGPGLVLGNDGAATPKR